MIIGSCRTSVLMSTMPHRPGPRVDPGCTPGKHEEPQQWIWTKLIIDSKSELPRLVLQHRQAGHMTADAKVEAAKKIKAIAEAKQDAADLQARVLKVIAEVGCPCLPDQLFLLCLHKPTIWSDQLVGADRQSQRPAGYQLAAAWGERTLRRLHICQLDRYTLPPCLTAYCHIRLSSRNDLETRAQQGGRGVAHLSTEPWPKFRRILARLLWLHIFLLHRQH